MNPTLHMPIKLHATPCRDLNRSAIGENLFTLEITYKPNGFPQVYNAVYVPPSLQGPLQNSALRSFHVETLQCNSHEKKALKNGPNYAVLGVELADGRTFTEIPVEWRRLRRRLSLIGIALLTTAVGLLFQDLSFVSNLLSAGVLTLGILELNASIAVPRTPFTVFSTRGDFTVEAITGGVEG
jgi:hypothetical protein